MDLKNKFIVIMEGKVGNSFGCLFYAHKIAKESGKDFVINSVSNVNRQADFYDLFSKENNFEHLSNSITELNNIMPPDVKFLLHKSHYVDSGAITGRDITYHRGLSEIELVNLVKSYDTVCYLDDASSHAMANPNVMVETASELKIDEEILKYVNSFCIENFGNEIISGIHIRATDWPWKQDCINSAYQTIQSLVEKNPNEKIFVCCDEEEIEDDLIKQLPDNIIVNKKESYVKKVVDGTWRETIDAGDGRKQDYNTLIDVQSAKEAFIDMLILSRTNIKYRHEHSSFSWFSEIYANLDILP